MFAICWAWTLAHKADLKASSGAGLGSALGILMTDGEILSHGSDSLPEVSQAGIWEPSVRLRAV